MAIQLRDVKAWCDDCQDPVKIDKELWCDSCGIAMSYDRRLMERGVMDDDLKRLRRDGCPECGDMAGTS